MLVALGAKAIETRGWSTRYRGRLLIHAARGLGPVGGRAGLAALCATAPFAEALGAAGLSAADLPRGAILAACELIDCLPVAQLASQDVVRSGNRQWRLSGRERAFGDYAPGRYAWLLADVRSLPAPIPAPGRLGLWEWAGELPRAESSRPY
jgi:hypothetical protein